MSEHVTEARDARVAAEDILGRLLDAAERGDEGASAEVEAWDAFMNNARLDIMQAKHRGSLR